MAWRRHEDVVWEEASDGRVYAALATDGEILVLDAVASSIFLLADGATAEAIVAQLAATGASEDEVLAGVEAFLEELRARGVVQHG